MFVYIINLERSIKGGEIKDILYDRGYTKYITGIWGLDGPSTYSSRWRVHSEAELNLETKKQFGVSNPPFTGYTEIEIGKPSNIDSKWHSLFG